MSDAAGSAGVAGKESTPERAGGAGPAVRVGLGIDAHGFAPDRPLILAGVRFSDTNGLAGHSDADVVAHAVMDAVLGAAGMEDIGALFPESDAVYAGVSSIELLRRVALRLSEAGWSVVNVDAVIVCEEPRVAPHRSAMRECLASALGLGVEDVNLRGTTTEGLGFTGRREGIAAQAVALLQRTRAK